MEMLRNLLHPRRHKAAFIVGILLVGALTGLGLLTNSLAKRQTKIEQTVKVQRVKVQQLLCEHPKTKSCEKHAYNLIVSCIAVPTCRRLLSLASTTPARTPIAAPTSTEVFEPEPEPEGGGPQPSSGHQQPGGSQPPPGHSHHSHPGNPTPTPAPPSPAPIVVPPPPPPAVPPGHEEGSPALKVCADLPLIKKCVEADVVVE
jgi:hypothetical protein